MTDPSPSPSPMPNWIKWTIGACLLATVIFAAITTTLALSGEPTLPQPLSSIVTIVLATAVVALLARGFTAQIIDRIIAHIDQSVGAVAARQDRRMNQIANGMIEAGIQLGEIIEHTGEIPKVRPLIVACPHPHDSGHAASAFDPTVLEVGERIARRILDN